MNQTTDKKNYFVSLFNEFENQLNEADFIRIHRSYIVNVNQIQQVELFEKSSYRLTLKSGDKLPVSKSGYSKLKDVLNI